MTYIVNSLAQYEVHVARYYYSRGAYVAAINRAQNALTDYQDVPALEEALFILLRSYDALGMTQLRDDTRRVMEKTYPQSEYLTPRLQVQAGSVVEVLVDRRCPEPSSVSQELLFRPQRAHRRQRRQQPPAIAHRRQARVAHHQHALVRFAPDQAARALLERHRRFRHEVIVEGAAALRLPGAAPALRPAGRPAAGTAACR